MNKDYNNPGVDGNGHVWIVNVNGASRFLGQTWEYHQVNSNSTIWPGIDGTVWIGNWTGLSQYQAGKWTHHAQADLPHGLLNPIGLQTKNGTLWLANWADERAYKVDLRPAIGQIYEMTDTLRVDLESISWLGRTAF